MADGDQIPQARGVSAAAGETADAARSAEAAQSIEAAQSAEAARSLIASKAALRRELIQRRAALAPQEREAAGHALRDVLLELPQIGMAGAIAAYVAFGSEPATAGLLFALWKRGSYVLLPVLREDNDLDWASYEGPDSLAPSSHRAGGGPGRSGPGRSGPGLLEPTEPRRGVGGIASADVVIVPALAVDRAGHRLGRGGGSYDRALRRVGPAVLRVALLYDHELIDEVPAGPHDQRVNAVARPGQGITRFG